ncbi:hypothetical protein MSG94_06475 [Acinetobacter baumannii]|nr:hypothetical protein [Acinetobacter baumannii]MDV4277996.1 hypothetical protein [Acinetobacter baumannii]
MNNTHVEHGCCEEDICGRNGCEGTIVKDTDAQGCSCHISPPCSYCHCEVQCNECDWASRNENVQEQSKPTPPSDWYLQMKQRENEFLRKINDHSVEFEKVEFRTESHSNSSMKKIGAYPRGMSKDQLKKEVDGTFGGRFEWVTENRFSFIAYTD